MLLNNVLLNYATMLTIIDINYEELSSHKMQIDTHYKGAAMNSFNH